VAVAPAISGKIRAVVINSMHGGFSLSPEAVRRMALLQGRPCYFFEGRSLHNSVRVAETELQNHPGAYALDIPNPAEVKEDEWSKHYISNRPDDRDDAILVQVVRELGARANGQLAELKVIEIPADVDWYVDEYDGKEWVSEKHRRWR